MPNFIDRYFGLRGSDKDEQAVRAVLQVGEELGVLSRYSKEFLRSRGSAEVLSQRLRWKYIKNETYAVWQKYNIRMPSLGVHAPEVRSTKKDPIKKPIPYSTGVGGKSGSAKPNNKVSVSNSRVSQTVDAPVNGVGKPSPIKQFSRNNMVQFDYPQSDVLAGFRPERYNLDTIMKYINRIKESPNFTHMCARQGADEQHVAKFLTRSFLGRFGELECGQAVNYPSGGMLTNSARLFCGPFQVGGPHTATMMNLLERSNVIYMFGSKNGEVPFVRSNMPSGSDAFKKFAQLIPGGFADMRTQAMIMVASVVYYVGKWKAITGDLLPIDAGILYVFHNQGFHGGLRQIVAQSVHGKVYAPNYSNQSADAKRVMSASIRSQKFKPETFRGVVAELDANRVTVPSYMRV